MKSTIEAKRDGVKKCKNSCTRSGPNIDNKFYFWLCKVLGQLSLAENPILINQKNIFFFRLLLLIGVHAEELSILWKSLQKTAS